MQSTIYYIPSISHHFQLPWKSSKNSACKSSKLSSKIPTLANSLRTQIAYELQRGVNNDGIESSNPTKLPVVVRRHGKVSMYFWDGNRVWLLSVDGGGSSGLSFCFNLDKVVEASSLAVRNFFIPKQVGENYIGYVKWKFLHRVFSSALQVLATQNVVKTGNVSGYRNWVFNLPAIHFEHWSRTAHSYISSALLASCIVGQHCKTNEFSMLYGNQYFLMLTPSYKQPPIHRSFAIADNLAEVSAKSQIQSVCFDNLGLMLAAVLNLFIKNNQRLQAGLPFILYPIFSAVDLFGIYQGLKYVHLQTLTKDRVEIIIDTWISFGYVPSPEEVSKNEEINFMWTKGKEPWRIRVGCLNPKGQLPKLSVMAMKSVGREDYCFVCTEIFYQGLARTREHGILLCVREGAHTADVIMGLFLACYVRNALRSPMWESMMEASDSSDLVIKEWFKLIDDGKQYVQWELGPLNEQMAAQGWVTKNILLNSEEQARYSYMD
ncbi:hypothetical protein V6N11_022880 [Hibiscus sabdariffa]|uniref:Protein root UVB sensitive/RUS domain-containing protein n=1 Tax=Hibiscus sabdariffa TaxID=183260 RepID=A0ABR2TKS5_9ROSI